MDVERVDIARRERSDDVRVEVAGKRLGSARPCRDGSPIGDLGSVE